MMPLMPLGQLLRSTIELAYPPACLCCQAPAQDELCPACAAALQTTTDRRHCEFCARPLAEASDCPYCQGRGIYPYERIATLGVFETTLKDLIHSAKYRRRWNIAETLAERLADSRAAHAILDDADILLPVPLWRWRQFSRGYNQADVIACRLAKFCKATVSQAVVRQRHTASQTELRSRKSRVDNVRGAFALKATKQITGKCVVVVDDVMTSGATLKEVGRMVLEAEPRSLSAIALAVADPRGRGFTAI